MKKTLSKIMASAAACAMLFSQFGIARRVLQMIRSCMSILLTMRRRSAERCCNMIQFPPIRFTALPVRAPMKRFLISTLISAAIGSLTAEQTEQVAERIYNAIMEF